LIVEDDPLQMMMAADLVEESGFTPLRAGNADQAIEVLERRDDICIVLTDVEMPGSMDGLKLAAVVRDRWPPIQLLVVSGNIVREKIDLPKASRFINKPYPPHQLISTLRSMALAC
jgi:CheY-like chemotaxis protein